MNDKDITKDVFFKLHMIYDNNPIVDPINYEIIFLGTRKQLKSAIKLLEISEIDYMVDWKEKNDPSKTYMLILKAETILLKSR